MKAISRCQECPVGAASGVGQGTFCPLITRAYPEGEVLYRKGEQASHIWFVKSGVLGLGEEERAVECPAQSGPGSFVGLEALVREEYDSTARFITAGSLCGATRSGFAQWLGPQSERTCVLLRDLLKVHDQ
jgi:CRP-like cAMP-binding protein